MNTLGRRSDMDSARWQSPNQQFVVWFGRQLTDDIYNAVSTCPVMRPM